ncbi:MAG: hypothetical protein IT210_14130 [Armatimonadetes bacterium]|nr:hypothetical protein [Armatimonadota bacterium]
MSAFKEGDRVKVREREATPEDIKSGLYYSHFPGLTGTVEKLFQDDTACVNVETESLPASIRVRHEEVEHDMRQKWLDNLSDEARNRLSEAEKAFHLKYAILVRLSDLEPLKGSAPKKPPRPAAQPDPIKAVSSKDLDQAEESFLEEMMKRAKRK